MLAVWGLIKVECSGRDLSYDKRLISHITMGKPGKGHGKARYGAMFEPERNLGRRKGEGKGRQTGHRVAGMVLLLGPSHLAGGLDWTGSRKRGQERRWCEKVHLRI